jgi:perosamine synthetase
MTMMATTLTVPLVSPITDDREVDAVARVIRSGQLAQGPEVKAFEEEFASVVGTTHAIAVNSGTAAVHAALEAVGVGDGDEVLTTPFTFAATATPILMQRARPRFIDIDPRTFNIDVDAMLAATGSATKAAVIVDLFGLPLDPASLVPLRARGVRIVEDACQAVGSSRDGVHAGAIGEVGAFSFYATKNLMTGEGGMLTTNDDAIAAAARRFRQHGMGERYEYLSLGYNYRMTDLLAAIGRVQLTRLADIETARRSVAARYDAGLAGVAGVTTPYVPAGVDHAYHQYSILIDGSQTRNGLGRDAVRGALSAAGVGTGVYYPTPLHVNPLFSKLGYGPGDFPNAERIATQILALPVHPKLSAEQVSHVVRSIREAVGEST